MVFFITLSLQRIEVVFYYSLLESMGTQESRDQASFPLNGDRFSLTKGLALLFSPDAFGLTRDQVYLDDTLLTIVSYPTF